MWGGDASDTAPGGRAGSVPGNCLDKSSVARAVSSAATDTPRDSTPVRRPEGISNHNRPRCWRTNSHTSRLRWSGPDTDSWRQRPYRPNSFGGDRSQSLAICRRAHVHFLADHWQRASEYARVALGDGGNLGATWAQNPPFSCPNKVFEKCEAN
jgi:hypothetical protein